MKRTVFQHPELRDANDNIIQQGAFGKNTALANSTNDGWIDYVANDLEALYDNINGARIYVASKAKLPATGDLSAMYIAEDTGKWYLWDGQKYIETDNARKIADEAIAARDAAKASANDAANSAREQQADWNVTDSSSKAYVKNKPTNLSAIGNTPQFSLNKLSKDDNGGNPVYFLMHELVQYNPDKPTLPISAVYGFNGMVFSELRVGNGGSQFLAIVKVGLGYEYNNLYSSSGHYSPVVIKDETNNKYYWAMKINGSYQRVYMLGTFSAPPLRTAILSVDIDGNLPEGWSLVYTAKPYPFDNTHVANADKDGQGNVIDTTYAKKSDLSSSVSTTSLTVSGTTSVPTANAGNSSKAIANTEFVAKSLASLVNGAPAQLNTLNELAKALGNDANFSATITAELAKKLNSTEAESTYLPLSGGTLTGVVNGVTPPNGDNSKKLATTEFVNAKAGNYLPLTGGTMTTGNTLITMGNGESYVRCWANGLYLGGTYRDNASRLVLFTNSNAGGFQLHAGNGTTFKQMNGYPDGTLTWDGQPLLPVGVVQAFAGTTIPNGWLLCDGSAVSRTDYAALFAVIGTTYGAGNGSTTFNLPNLTDKFIQGSATAGTVKSAGLPNITGNVKSAQKDDGLANGVFSQSPIKNFFYAGSPYTENDNATMRHIYLYFDASKSNAIYGKSNTVQPPAVTMRYIIKY